MSRISNVFRDDDVVLQGFLFGSVVWIIEPCFLDRVSDTKCFLEKCGRWCAMGIVLILINPVRASDLVV